MNRLAPLILALAFGLTPAADALGPDALIGGPGAVLGATPGPSDPGGKPPHGGHGKGDWGRPLTAAEIDLAITTLRQIDPDSAKELDKLREREPDEISKHIRQRFPRIREFLTLKERDPKMFELRVQDLKLWHQSRDLANAVTAARNSDEKAKADELVDQLEALAEQHFEVRQQIRQRELEKLEAQLDRLREQLEERADEKGDLIEAHVAKLIEGDSSEW